MTLVLLVENATVSWRLWQVEFTIQREGLVRCAEDGLVREGLRKADGCRLAPILTRLAVELGGSTELPCSDAVLQERGIERAILLTFCLFEFWRVLSLKSIFDHQPKVVVVYIKATGRLRQILKDLTFASIVDSPINVGVLRRQALLDLLGFEEARLRPLIIRALLPVVFVELLEIGLVSLVEPG